MQLLLLETSDGRYALDTRHVVEILPLLRIKRIPAAPAYVAGMINYQGVPVPVFDLSSLEGGEPCRHYFSTRIILVSYPLDGEDRTVGVMAEGVTDIVRCTKDDIRATGVLLNTSSDGKGGTAQDEIVQLFDVARMIPIDIVRELL